MEIIQDYRKSRYDDTVLKPPTTGRRWGPYSTPPSDALLTARSSYAPGFEPSKASGWNKMDSLPAKKMKLVFRGDLEKRAQQMTERRVRQERREEAMRQRDLREKREQLRTTLKHGADGRENFERYLGHPFYSARAATRRANPIPPEPATFVKDWKYFHQPADQKHAWNRLDLTPPVTLYCIARPHLDQWAETQVERRVAQEQAQQTSRRDTLQTHRQELQSKLAMKRYQRQMLEKELRTPYSRRTPAPQLPQKAAKTPMLPLHSLEYERFGLEAPAASSRNAHPNAHTHHPTPRADSDIGLPSQTRYQDTTTARSSSAMPQQQESSIPRSRTAHVPPHRSLSVPPLPFGRAVQTSPAMPQQNHHGAMASETPNFEEGSESAEVIFRSPSTAALPASAQRQLHSASSSRGDTNMNMNMQRCEYTPSTAHSSDTSRRGGCIGSPQCTRRGLTATGNTTQRENRERVAGVIDYAASNLRMQGKGNWFAASPRPSAVERVTQGTDPDIRERQETSRHQHMTDEVMESMQDLDLFDRRLKTAARRKQEQQAQ
eukprot:gnl/Trimastix_PCT/1912.p1 GENE.gnl/Trimastix_PCT/1912~~gnl/Trimastix_PCT/1912.p1  ORF type:complete len:548 (-),score=84.63 gnl/Trimastix_PCT/1912:70-1713(-)